MMRTTSIIAAATSLAASLAPAVAHADASTRSQGAAILAGTAERDAPAVVALASALGTISCSGTLVSPRLVLTAAHCLDGWTDLAFFGSDPAVDGVFVEVAATEAHPRLDVAVVVLSRPAPVRPAALLRRPPDDSDLGREVTFVGYGVGAAGDFSSMGTKRRASATLESIGADLLGYRDVTCHGDSGGPAFLDGRLAGVTSRGEATCTGEAVSIRVDVVAGWVDEALARLDPALCALDQRCVAACPAPDPDCHLTPSFAAPDEGPTASGCASGVAPVGAGGVIVASGLALLRLAWRAGRRRRRAVLLAALAAPLSGCSGEGGEDEDLDSLLAARLCEQRFVGDPALPAAIEVVTRSRADALEVGVLAANMDGCAIALRARLFDQTTRQEVLEAGGFVQIPEAPPAILGARLAGFLALPAPPPGGYSVVVAAEDALGRGAIAEQTMLLLPEAP